MTKYCARTRKKFPPFFGRYSLSGQGARSLFFWLVVAVFSTVCALFPMSGAVPVQAANSMRQADTTLLAGQWIRPDGGYVLELSDSTKDGKLTAAYFNPRRINVSRAELRSTKGKVSIVVELRDVNYPGSRYNLQYDPASDRLKGTYFQAVEKLTYDVEFVRMR
jgi:hypothetical protein